ncbi:MAG TPA: family 16 glycoside hydrolase, partial [Opitutales bacterium]|nr:family 16 glycoside hydrolase [Opitutales bacterium]
NITDGPIQQNLWPISFQAQTKTTFAGDFICMSTAKCAEGVVTGTGQPTANKQKDPSEKPIGEWNVADVVVHGDTMEYTVNGVLQNKITQCVPSFGKIGFQLEGYPYEMRNIKLAPLPADKPAAKP